MGSVWIVRNEAEATVLVDPMRREILRLIAPTAHTGHELSDMLGMSPPAVCHHLQALKAADFVRVERTEAGSRGMVRKFYRASAAAFIIDYSKLPLEMKRYFAPMQFERARGLIGGLSMNRLDVDISAELVETLCDVFSRKVVEVAEEVNRTMNGEDPESIVTRIYQEALARVLHSDTQIFRALSPAVPVLRHRY